jgi:FkbM family methyltransferase
MKQNFFSKILQKYLFNKDIRKLRNSLFYYLFFRLIRNFLKGDVKIKVYNFFINASVAKNKMSNKLLKKCYTGEEEMLEVIEKISNYKKVFLLDCGANYGFYSLFAASLSEANRIIGYEASPITTDCFRDNVRLNNYNNILSKNLAISDSSEEYINFNESLNDWESSATHELFLERVVKIKTATIDSELHNKNLNDFSLIIKLDIEGNEFNAIQGGINSIGKYDPLIIIELSKYNLNNKNYNFIFFKNFLSEKKYMVYNKKLRPVTLDMLINDINNLDKNNQTIGNYFLIKNSSYLHNLLLN